ncbi:Glycosyl transferase family 2 [Brevibacterium linens]|uniref:Glycosyl transferase family 2 n=2 Tax=Brevibacterium linens TaxID=1703 RepID=A0A2H1K5X6_BRELN|nr:Glycosyl transferase family 2 [Brevibacterium linens]
MVGPILTIGITSFERPASLLRAIYSVVEQVEVSRNEVEVIVVDDASASSDVISVLKSIDGGTSSGFVSLRVIRHETGSGGPSQGRNDIIENAAGRYVFFLDDDNYFAAGSLRYLCDYARSSSADWISLRRRRNGRSYFRSPAGVHEGLNREQALWTFLIAGAFRRSWLIDSGLRFDPEVAYGEDNEFVLELVCRSSSFSALCDRDYVIESDPGKGENPHISHLANGAGFVSTLVEHVRRLTNVIVRCTDIADERTDLSKLVLKRSLNSYKLDRKISALEDLERAHEFLLDWRSIILRVLSRDDVLSLVGGTVKREALEAILCADIEGLKASVSSSYDSASRS